MALWLIELSREASRTVEGGCAHGGVGWQSKKAKKAEKGASKPSVQRLNHSLDIIGAFGKLKMSVPLTSDQVCIICYFCHGCAACPDACFKGWQA